MRSRVTAPLFQVVMSTTLLVLLSPLASLVEAQSFKPVPSPHRVSHPAWLAADEDFAVIEVAKKCKVRVVRYHSDQPVVWLPPNSYYVSTGAPGSMDLPRTRFSPADCAEIFIPQHNDCGINVFEGIHNTTDGRSPEGKLGTRAASTKFWLRPDPATPSFAPFPGCYFSGNYSDPRHDHTYLTLVWKSQTRPAPEPSR
jgi:hypothetical protein